MAVGRVNVAAVGLKVVDDNDMSKVADSVNYGAAIYALTQDADYVYVGGTIQTVQKLRKSDMSKVAESVNYGGVIRTLTQDADYVYVGGITTRTVQKLIKHYYKYKDLKLIPLEV